MDYKIAVLNPNLHGDTLWSVPAVRALSLKLNAKVDFWLSYRNRQLRDLLEAQDFIHKVFIEDESLYVTGGIWGGDWSHEPRNRVALSKAYARQDELGYCAPPGHPSVYELHMRHEGGRTLLDWFCMLVGVPRGEHRFDLPDGIPSYQLPPKPFAVIATKPWHTDRLDAAKYVFNDCLAEFIKILAKDGIPVVEVGSQSFGGIPGTIDRRSDGFLEMAGIISQCEIFVGTMSAPLVVADAFPWVHRIAAVDIGDWDSFACTISGGMNHYIHLPSGSVLASMALMLIGTSPLSHILPCECQHDGYCERYKRQMAGRLRDICRGKNIDAGISASYRALWLSDSRKGN